MSAPVTIEGLSHEGRGLARVAGKATFVDGALPGERVVLDYTRRRGRFDEARIGELLAPAAERVAPACPQFGTCGGCSLQHLAPAAQRAHKERVLLEQLRHIAGIEPETVEPPLAAGSWGYRRRARLGVRLRAGRPPLVGFRQRNGRALAGLPACDVLVPMLGDRLPALAELVGGLEAGAGVPQLELAAGDHRAAVVVRHTRPLGSGDRARLAAFARRSGWQVWLQPGGPDTAVPLSGDGGPPLAYALQEFDVELGFRPTDFVQVNAPVNRALVHAVVSALTPRPGERVLDLYCGLGNFTLPLARRAGTVAGIEGSAALVERARANARDNGIDNVRLGVADLAVRAAVERVGAQAAERVLIDPPRTGALAVVRHLPLARLRRLVYVSCNPATLARDAGVLVHERGLALRRVRLVDMFPHTTHAEAMAVFEPAA